MISISAVLSFSLLLICYYAIRTEKTVSILGVRVYKLLMITSVLVSVYSTLIPVHYLPSDGNQQKRGWNVKESNELHIWWFVYRKIVLLSANHTPPDDTLKREPSVAQGTR
ncbi:hypothetical protein AVEN_5931-1 [Araneus ventricosus]|uniref:Uncharacterized protein n=1 Tax=Araneus ventricosus TaxID=182803 RepID=A0A4Y2F040_ARAVE|nr:hypothetical protein AVEN_5931-1 [Araneus ventricosus]